MIVENKEKENDKTIKPDIKENNNNIITHGDKTINYGDLVIIYETGDSIKYFTLEKGKRFQNKYA